jgi:hypothetical protein
MSTFKLNKLFETCDIGSRHNGKILREKVEPFILDNKKVSLDFEGINLVTQSFIDEVLGVLIRKKGPIVTSQIKFKNCNESVKGVVKLVVSYSSKMAI